MNMVFDIEHERSLLRGPVGVGYYVSKSLDESASNRAVSQTAQFMLNSATHCVLVCFDNEAKKLLRKSKEWLEYAIRTAEKCRNYFRYGTEASRYENLALCNWLLSDLHDRQNLDAAVRNEDLYNETDRQDKISTSIVLPVYIDAGEYGKALELFDSYWGGKRPANVKRVRGEAAMAYVIAAAKRRQEYSDDEVSAAFQSFLCHQVPEFLEHGDYSALARWLKIAFWNDNPTHGSAFETVRKCFDYLPNVANPKLN